ncbi:MAG TPA: hypothetical protein VFU62_13235 [Hanamia sp.]|nr:hypothetical protein [Hanamia sp.]
MHLLLQKIQYHDDQMHGKCLVIVKSGTSEGRIKVTASSPGMIPGSVNIYVD